MAITTEKKRELIESYKTHDGDTGSADVQIAILSERIGYLTEHFKTHARATTPAGDSLNWLAREGGFSIT